MFFVHGRGGVTCPSSTAYAAEAHVDGPGDRVRVLGTAMRWTWPGIQVGDDVVTGVVSEELEAATVVFGTGGCCLAVVAALGDVVRDAWEDQARVA